MQNSMKDVSVALRRPCLCPLEGHQQGVSIQISINLGESCLPNNVEMKNRTGLSLGNGFFVYQLSITYQILDSFIEWLPFLSSMPTTNTIRLHHPCTTY